MLLTVNRPSGPIKADLNGPSEAVRLMLPLASYTVVSTEPFIA